MGVEALGSVSRDNASQRGEKEAGLELPDGQRGPSPLCCHLLWNKPRILIFLIFCNLEQPCRGEIIIDTSYTDIIFSVCF